jgi:DNA-binding response OmpR family regulator
MREPTTPADSFGDLALLGDGHAMQVRGEVVVLPAAEMQLVASLVKAQGRAVRRTVLEMKAWGIWTSVAPEALGRAVQRVRAELALLGSNVRIAGSEDSGFALAQA